MFFPAGRIDKIMSESGPTNYPDLLGVITGGPRVNFEDIQCAVTTRPEKIGIGQNFEAILLIQSTVDVDVDVILEFEMPARDANNQKGMFFAKSTRIQVGLQPAEVGYITMPAACSPKTTPANNYHIDFKIQAKRMVKQANRVRLPQGGGAFADALLPEHTRQEMQNLRQLRFSIDTGGKRNQLQDTFEIVGRASIAKIRELKPDWISLWTMRDYMDDDMLLNQVRPELTQVMPYLKREVIFRPLMQTTQERFKACGYPLHMGEIIFITKLLTLVMEKTSQHPLSEIKKGEMPGWLKQMARMFFQDKSLANQMLPLLSVHLYPTVVHDAIRHGFMMVKTVLKEDFGSDAEMQEYADTVMKALLTKEPLDFARVYLPLVAAGVIANPQITMPNENTRDTIHMLSQSQKQRMSERNEENAFIFDIMENLIQRALEHF